MRLITNFNINNLDLNIEFEGESRTNNHKLNPSLQTEEENHYIQSNIGDKNKPLADAINEYNMEITKDQEIIRNHANFRQIRSDYERTMEEYLTRIEEYRNHPS